LGHLLFDFPDYYHEPDSTIRDQTLKPGMEILSQEHNMNHAYEENSKIPFSAFKTQIAKAQHLTSRNEKLNLILSQDSGRRRQALNDIHDLIDTYPNDKDFPFEIFLELYQDEPKLALSVMRK